MGTASFVFIFSGAVIIDAFVGSLVEFDGAVDVITVGCASFTVDVITLPEDCDNCDIFGLFSTCF